MDNIIEKYIKIFCCPNDHCSLELYKNYLKCPKCKRRFSIFSKNFVEILPKEIPQWDLSSEDNKQAEEEYKRICLEKFTWTENPKGWGFFPELHAGSRAFVKKEIDKIKNMILSYRQNGLIIDVSGGSGNYSLPLSSMASLMIHCETDIQSLLTAYYQANKLKIKNIIFVRANYLKLPFQDNTFDVIICTDTLERGRNHEIKLIKEIYRILKEGGIGILDFHNLRPLAKTFNPKITFYSKREIEVFLMKLNIKNFEIYPFGYFPTSLALSESMYLFLDKFLFFLPPIRYIVVIKK
jgi:ubiquinone/menaquinone biosynthesis C-methylase UbiE